ncbi:MAG: hypothetical protein E7773_11155 [Sphingomonas sp.]|uniref:hypothetical protein n=1 Tax=Sphingomonas sp. TaxID=28214 RepID=UPI0012060A80|nr:hypothetical protein [Sphingomonas sp.]THD35018.1 MAG: hypothetical protein E7773_11155 [Sphingomonas sp.]
MIRPKEYALSGWLEAQARAWHEEMGRGVFDFDRRDVLRNRALNGYVVDDALRSFFNAVVRFDNATIQSAATLHYLNVIKSAPNP